MSKDVTQLAQRLTSVPTTGVRKLTWWAILAALGCAFIWAGQSVAVKFSLQGIPPLSIMALRFVIAMPVVFGASLILKVSLRPTKTEWKPLALSGAMLCCQIALFTLGTKATTSVHSTILINTFPFFAAFAAHFLLDDHRLNFRLVLGIAVAFSGITLLVTERFDSSTSGSLMGNLMLVIAAFFVGTKIVLMKRILEKTHPVKLAFWDGVAAIAIFGSVALALETGETFTLTPAVLGGMAYQGIAVTAAGVLLWLFLLSRFSANKLSVFRLFTPPLGVLLGALLLREPVSLFALLSLLLVCLGLFFVLNERPNKKKST